MPANANTSLGPTPPKVIARDVLQALTQHYPLLTSFATGFNEKPLRKGQTGKIKITKERTAKKFVQGDGYQNTGLDYDEVDVVIDQHDYDSIALTETERMEHDSDPYKENIANSAHALGKAATDHVLGLITPTNFPTEFIQTAANSDYTVLTAAHAKARENKMPATGRYAIQSGPVWDTFSEDQRVTSRDYRPVNPDYRAGSVANVKSFDRVMEYADLPTADNLLGFYGTKRALVFASAVPTDPGAYMPGLKNNGHIIEIVEYAGLQMMIRYWYDPRNGDLQMDLTWLYGAKVLDAKCGVRQVSA
jgi:hypothetical protein